MSKYRKLLLEIDDELHGDELDCLKFLCMPFIRRRPVSDVARGHHLFGVLESNCLINENANDMSFLHRLLHRIGRKDLCNMIERNIHIQVDSKLECLDHDGFKFYEILYEISEDMGPEDVSSLKYLYTDVPRNRKIKSGIDLFSLLIDRDLLSPTNLDSLIDNFSYIGRKDLMHKLNDFKVKTRIPSCSVNYGEDEPSMASNKTAQQTSSRIPTMETEEISGCSNETHPKEIYYFSDDLARRMSSMQVGDEGKGDGVFQKGDKNNKLEKVCPSLNTSSSFNAEKGSGDVAMSTPVPLVGVMATEGDVKVNADRCKSQYPGVPVDNKVLPRYKMDAIPRGVCLVIDNWKFTYDQQDCEAKELKDRRGSDKDTENIKKCFETLKFEVRVKSNLTDREMQQVFEKHALDKRNQCHDCFVSFILSHGGRTDRGLPFLYGSNGRRLYPDCITRPFRPDSCPSLCGKPKLFFLVCCLGRSYSKAVPRSVVHLSETDRGVYTDAVSGNFNEQEEEPVTTSFVCNDQDFLIGYSTVLGNVSFRDTLQGTWYITALTQVFSEYHKRESLQHMLVAVNEQVTKNSHRCTNKNGEMGQYAQVPAPQHTLTKQLWF